MKLVKLTLLRMIAIVLIILAFPRPGDGIILIPVLLEMLKQAKENAARRSEQITLVKDLVKSIGDKMDGVPSPSGEISPDQQVRNLKEAIKGENDKAMAYQKILNNAVKQLQPALDRYTKNDTKDNYKAIEALVKIINDSQNNLNESFELIKTWISKITKIRRDQDEKEWDNLESGKYKAEREKLDKLWISLKEVPNVVGKTYQTAVAELWEVGLVVGGVVVKPAPDKESSEKVTKQVPAGGEPIPANRTVKLWHYDRFGSTRSEGFQPGDAQRIDRRFETYPEIISPDGNSIHLDSKAGLGWGIMKLGSRGEALGKIKAIDGPFATIKGWKESSGEKIIKGRTSTPDESLFWDTWRMYDGSTPPTTSYHHIKLYRDVFIIGYSENTRKFDDNLADNWPPIYENSKQLVDERFPPTGPAISLGEPPLARKVGD